MGIIRVEAITFGVEDIEQCLRFCADFGFEPLETGEHGGTFRTLENQLIKIRGAGDTSLPPALEAGSTLRDLVWGVDRPEALKRIERELSTDRNIKAHGDGGITTIDETGYPIGFRLAEPIEVHPDPRPFNCYSRIERWNVSLGPHGRAHPIGISHVVLDLPKEGREKAAAFYTDRLDFKAVDTVLPTGTFLQCEGSIDHHQLFLLHRSDRVGINHVAFDVQDFDEVIEGGNYMVEKGWKENRRMGRHTIGSNVYRFFTAPVGGRFEYSADMDKVAKTFPPRVWEAPPPHHIWMIKTNGDS